MNMQSPRSYGTLKSSLVISCCDDINRHILQVRRTNFRSYSYYERAEGSRRRGVKMTRATVMYRLRLCRPASLLDLDAGLLQDRTHERDLLIKEGAQSRAFEEDVLDLIFLQVFLPRSEEHTSELQSRVD